MGAGTKESRWPIDSGSDAGGSGLVGGSAVFRQLHVPGVTHGLARRAVPLRVDDQAFRLPVPGHDGVQVFLLGLAHTFAEHLAGALDAQPLRLYHVRSVQRSLRSSVRKFYRWGIHDSSLRSFYRNSLRMMVRYRGGSRQCLRPDLDLRRPMPPRQGTPTTQPALFHRSCWTHKYVYLIGCAEYGQIYARANHACEMCGATNYLGLDHDHILGSRAIRGVLCPKCNGGHMRRVDAGERPVDERARQYLINAWHLQREGREIGYEPAVNPTPADIGSNDVAELRRLVRTSMHWDHLIADAGLKFEHPGVAACVANNDFRPVYRLIYLSGGRRAVAA